MKEKLETADKFPSTNLQALDRSQQNRAFAHTHKGDADFDVS